MDLSAPTNCLIYLHGFASGPGSTKARFFKSALEQVGVETIVPDLNVPCFEKMTLSAQLQLLQSLIENVGADKSLALMGSSMGGLLATMAARKFSRVQKLVLLAPGFGITRRWQQLVGEEGMTDWKSSGGRPFFHYAMNREMNLAYSFIEDLNEQQTDQLVVPVPTLVYHGKNDDTVPVDHSREFAYLNKDLVTLNELDDGHELTASMNLMWQGAERFLLT